MFQEPDYREDLSLMLSEVLDDIGVNETMVMGRRRRTVLLETMINIINRLTDYNITDYYLGSQREGTTTMGLKSDFDSLACDNHFNIIQDRSELEHGKRNYLMIQNENTTPGYCFLQQQLHPGDEFLPPIPAECHIIDKSGRVLLKNTLNHGILESAVNHGPSLAEQGQHGFFDSDKVLAFPCKSWPQSAAGWLERQGIGRWPTQHMRRNAASTRCFVVPTGSKVSEYPELEWRISTSLAERDLILNLNITQIRCFVLLKMILKSFLNPNGEINISSFMCKTVLLHYIENTEPSIWKENNLLMCLSNCLSELQKCVEKDFCAHFIIQENNLMAGKFTEENKKELLKNIREFRQNDRQMLLRIDIDYLGYRLHFKQGMVPHGVYFNHFFVQIYERFMTSVYLNTALLISHYHSKVLIYLDVGKKRMEHYISKLKTFYVNGDRLELDAVKFLAPFLFTTYGSALASSSIGGNNQVPPQALVWLYDGLNSDISSSRLKLASVFYSSGDMEKAELILRHTEQQYYSYPVLPICDCFKMPLRLQAITAEFMRECNEPEVDCNKMMDCIRHITAFCVRFIQEEINCVPHELQYEMFRSTQDDMIHRRKYLDNWMQWAVVDSLPLLYFLQYKIYRHLQRHQDQQQALSKLIRTTVKDENLNHRETALNILGQCMEQENRPQQALKCYLLSLRERKRNNAAKVHICKLLSRVFATQ